MAAYKFFDSTGDTTTTTGTGTLTLAGVAPTGYATITGALANSDKVVARIEDSGGTNWEIAECTYTTSGTTLSRDTVLRSSNADAAVSFAAGTKNVYIVDSKKYLSAAVLTTQGDILRSDGTRPTRLALGTSGQTLNSNGADPVWTTIVGGGVKAYSNTTVAGGNTVANTVTETAFGSTYTIPGNTLSAGDVVRINLWGVYSTKIATTPTMTLKIKAGSTVLVNTSAVTLVGNVSNLGWSLVTDLSFFTIGASGTCDAQASGDYESAVGTTISFNAPATATTTIDTTADEAITVTATWSAADLANIIQLRQMNLLLLRAQGNATPVATAQGGTNITSFTTGDILYASSSSVLSKLPIGTETSNLVVVAGIPFWRPDVQMQYAASRGALGN